MVFADARMVRGLNGGKLDGEWTNSVSTVSGNNFEGPSGNDFAFRFNVLPGDFDGNNLTLGSDANQIFSRVISPIAGPNYSIRADLDGNGFVLASDANSAFANAIKTLPASNPTQPAGTGGEGGFGQGLQAPANSGNSNDLALPALLEDEFVDYAFVGPRQMQDRTVEFVFDLGLEEFLSKKGRRQ